MYIPILALIYMVMDYRVGLQGILRDLAPLSALYLVFPHKSIAYISALVSKCLSAYIWCKT